MKEDSKINNEEKNSGKKNGFVPSYAKKGNTGKQKRKILPLEIKSKISLIIIISIAVIIIAAIIGIAIFLSSLKYKPYKQYEEYMKIYVFDIVYDNHTAKTSQKVTKSEAIKMVLSAVFNTSDISGFAREPEEEYENAIWVQYAVDRGMIPEGEITKDNYNKKATYIDVIRYFAAAKMKILEKALDTSNVKIKDINSYTPDEQLAINDMVYNNIFELKSSKVNGKKKVFKGKLNEMIKNFVEKYNTITLDGQKININPEKIPSNASEYPYTLANVDKNVYEIPFIISDSTEFKNPRTLYLIRKEFYTQMVEKAEGYLNNIVNVDYSTIALDDMSAKYEEYNSYSISDEQYNEYINHVKQNHIKINGKASVQSPALYYDGVYYRVRTKVEFNIESADTDKNLLFGDMLQGNGIEYKDKKYTIYVDLLMENVGGNRTTYVDPNCIYTMIPNKDNVKISELGGE